MNLEQQAIELSKDKKKLKARLLKARSCLCDDLRVKFKNYIYDFSNQRLVGDGVTLQWMVREFPAMPESYENQQTSQGIVIFWNEMPIK